MKLFFDEFQPVFKDKKGLFESFSVRDVKGEGERIAFKLALSDVDLLNMISSYQLSMLE